MLSISQVKYINSLKILKYRIKNNAFIIEGPKILKECANSDLEIQSVFAIRQWIEKQGHILQTRELLLQEITERELNKVSSLSTPNQVIAIVRIPQVKLDLNKLFNDLVLVIDDIKDPGNFGTIIRTADWFGISDIVCSKTCVDVYNPKVIQATMGSFVRISVHYVDIRNFLAEVPEQLSVFGTFMDGDNIYNKHLPDNGIVMIGNESRGIDKKYHSFITDKIAIPAIRSEAESLNASIAAGIVLSEFRRLSDQ